MEIAPNWCTDFALNGPWEFGTDVHIRNKRTWILYIHCNMGLEVLGYWCSQFVSSFVDFSYAFHEWYLCNTGCIDLYRLFKETLYHWGWVTHICVGILTIIGSDNGLLPGRHQAIIWTNAIILLIGSLGTNFSEIIIEIHILSFKKMHSKMSSGNLQPFHLGLNVLS